MIVNSNKSILSSVYFWGTVYFGYVVNKYVLHHSLAVCYLLIDSFLSFRDLLSWNRDSTRKCEHLFPVWSFLLSDYSHSPPPQHHHSQGSSRERWSRNTLSVVTARVYLRPQGIFYVPPFYLIQLRRQYHLTWSATHDIVSRKINLRKSFHLLREWNQWSLDVRANPSFNSVMCLRL